jgi:hypothetical protein
MPYILSFCVVHMWPSSPLSLLRFGLWSNKLVKLVKHNMIQRIQGTEWRDSVIGSILIIEYLDNGESKQHS